MTILSLIAGGAGIAVIFLLLYGVSKIRQGRAQERLKNLKSEIDSVIKAREIEDNHKHDSRSDIINRL